MQTLTPFQTRRGWLVAGILGVGLAGLALAQYAPSGPKPYMPHPAKDRTIPLGTPAGEPLLVHRLIGAGRQTILQTPEYRTTIAKSATRPKEWAQISVRFDTLPLWLDSVNVEFNVMTMMRLNGQVQYSVYKLTMELVDVEQGRDHLCVAYIAPSALKRYGPPVATHVQFVVDGKPVAKADDLDPALVGQLPPDWWENRQVLEKETVHVREGYLLRLSATPFALINTDDYEVTR